MADEISIVPRITYRETTTQKVIGIAAFKIDQTGLGSFAESKRIPNTTPVTIGIVAAMVAVGVCHLSNLSVKGGGDDNLILAIGATDVMLLKPGEQFNFRLMPGAAYTVEASSTTGCDYSITIFED